jgi:uncharacterized protein YdeI (YjbR/CyaY-like superfamily)
MSEPNILTVETREQLRRWLVQHHATKPEVWLTIYKKKYQDQGLTLDEAVEEALCFGWIDSTLRSIDEQRYALRFSPRNKRSVWSVSNINRVKKLINEGKMTEAGLLKINEARDNGEWDAAIQREKVDDMPENLLHALSQEEGALTAYKALTNSQKKQYLYWLQSAKRAETKIRRIQSIVKEVMGNLNVQETK